MCFFCGDTKVPPLVDYSRDERGTHILIRPEICGMHAGQIARSIEDEIQQRTACPREDIVEELMSDWCFLQYGNCTTLRATIAERGEKRFWKYTDWPDVTLQEAKDWVGAADDPCTCGRCEE